MWLLGLIGISIDMTIVIFEHFQIFLVWHTPWIHVPIPSMQFYNCHCNCITKRMHKLTNLYFNTQYYYIVQELHLETKTVHFWQLLCLTQNKVLTSEPPTTQLKCLVRQGKLAVAIMHSCFCSTCYCSPGLLECCHHDTRARKLLAFKQLCLCSPTVYCCSK